MLTNIGKNEKYGEIFSRLCLLRKSYKKVNSTWEGEREWLRSLSSMETLNSFVYSKRWFNHSRTHSDFEMFFSLSDVYKFDCYTKWIELCRTLNEQFHIWISTQLDQFCVKNISKSLCVEIYGFPLIFIYFHYEVDTVLLLTYSFALHSHFLSHPLPDGL